MIITIGLSVMILFFLVLAFLLDEQYAVYKIISLFMGIWLVLLLVSHLNVITDNYYCDILVKNETITQGGNFTSYEYARVCYPYGKNTTLSAFKIVNYFIRYIPWYAFIMLLYLGAKELGFDLLDKLRNMFQK